MTEQYINRFLAARKGYIEKQFSNLNPMQREAVLTTEGPLLLLAGAGSGKTTVLIHRILNLLRYGKGSDTAQIPENISCEDVEFLEGLGETVSPSQRLRADHLCAIDPPAPWSILAVTFTNKAANEMKQRLADLFGSESQDIWAMTFHSACCRILRRDIACMGYSRNFTIYDSSDSERLMKEIIKDMGLDDKTFPPRYVLGAISREKDQLITPDDMQARAERTNDIRALRIAQAYTRYQTALKDNNALDFDDLIFVTVSLLEQHPDVLKYYQQKFQYVLVDEYQDTNYMQYRLTKLLSDGHKNICVVGDDDQSIYRFRGATIENILNFEKAFRGARTIRLEQNYRSTQLILNAANAVIAHNLGRKGKRLWTDNGQGDPVTVYEAADQRAEGSYIAGRILKESNGNNLNEYAILYRTNAQSNALEEAMKRSRIPYRIIGGTRFFDRAEIKDVLSYLCIINNRADDLRLGRIINNPPRGIGQKTVETAQRLSHAEKKPLYDIISSPDSYGPLEKAAGKLKQFCSMIEELSSLLEQGIDLTEFYDIMLERTGYVAMLTSKDTEENISRLENVQELKSSIQSYVQDAFEPSLSGFLEEIALYTDLEEYKERDNAVVMMTMHAAKGLEFPNVFLVGFEDGLFPGMRAIGDSEEMEEERRLCYVAITRAKKHLTITHVRQRMIYGRTCAAIPSRFLKEIPPECVVKKGGYPATSDYSAPYTPPVRASYQSVIRPMSTASVKILDVNPGDMVMHSAFGRGMVLSVLKMSGDALLEVAFDDVGTKKMMAKTATAHMKKL